MTPAIQRTLVQDCSLWFPDKELKMPVAKFSVTFALDSIPRAEVVPALGRNIVTGTQALLKDVENNMRVDLLIKINDVESTLLSGYVQDISGNDNSTPFARKLSTRITIMHLAIRLAGAPPTSFGYSTKHPSVLASLSSQKGTGNIFTDKVAITNAELIISFLQHLNNEKGAAIADFPGEVLKFVVQDIMEKHNPLLTPEELDVLIRTWDPANLTQFNPVREHFVISVAKKFSQGWTSTNTFSALVSTANYLFMHVVPFNTGFYLGNPFSLLRTPCVNVKSSEYINMSTQTTFNLQEPVDGVILQSPTGQERHYITYPEKVDANAALPKERYYHIRQYPDWVLPVYTYQYGFADKIKVTADFRSRIKARGWEPGSTEAEDFADYLANAGTRVAQAMYATDRMQKAQMQLMFPYREDIMPGTMVTVENSGAEDMSFMGDNITGMVNKTVFMCDMFQQTGQLNMAATLSSLRNTEDNTNPDLTFETHPVYQQNWTGINLDGSLVCPKPESATPSSPSATSTNNSGQEEPKTAAERAAAGEQVTLPTASDLTLLNSINELSRETS